MESRVAAVVVVARTGLLSCDMFERLKFIILFMTRRSRFLSSRTTWEGRRSRGKRRTHIISD